MCESEALGGRATIKTITPVSLFSKAMTVRGPLNCDEERSAIWLRIYIRVCVARARTHTQVESQQASIFLLWECETSPSHSLVPGGNGTEHLANQLQLSPPGLKVSPPTGVIYSQVERENRSLTLCFSSSQAGWVAWGSWLRGDGDERGGGFTETKIMIYKANLDFCFLLFAISKAMEVAVCLR